MTSGTNACAVTATVATDSNYTAGSVGPTNVNATLASQAVLSVTGVPAVAQAFGAEATGWLFGRQRHWQRLTRPRALAPTAAAR